MAQYMLSVWHENDYEIDFTTPDAQRQVAQVGQFNEDLVAGGSFVFAAGLHPASTATVMRPGADGVTTTDGPFVESKEQIGGFWIIDVPDLTAAEDLARRAAAACEGPVELRPLQGD